MLRLLRLPLAMAMLTATAAGRDQAQATARATRTDTDMHSDMDMVSLTAQLTGLGLGLHWGLHLALHQAIHLSMGTDRAAPLPLLPAQALNLARGPATHRTGLQQQQHQHQLPVKREKVALTLLAPLLLTRALLREVEQHSLHRQLTAAPRAHLPGQHLHLRLRPYLHWQPLLQQRQFPLSSASS